MTDWQVSKIPTPFFFCLEQKSPSFMSKANLFNLTLNLSGPLNDFSLHFLRIFTPPFMAGDIFIVFCLHILVSILMCYRKQKPHQNKLFPILYKTCLEIHALLLLVFFSPSSKKQLSFENCTYLLPFNSIPHIHCPPPSTTIWL